MKEVREKDILDEDEMERVHPWKLCPIGKHYVREHQERIPPSKKHPKGEVIIRHAHCANNPKKKNKKIIKDILSFGELQAMTKTYFSELPGAPKANALHFRRADEFDELIGGWVYYWNEVFKSQEKLDSNLVKALMASESSFKPETINCHNPKKIGCARGLMQITDESLRILHGQESGLSDHFIFLSHAEIMDPSANVCAGVRWLYLKRAGAKERYVKANKNNHDVTWEDAVAEYKGVLKGIIENKNPDPEGKMPKFRSLYKKLQE